jgi:hypothetical protein
MLLEDHSITSDEADAMLRELQQVGLDQMPPGNVRLSLRLEVTYGTDRRVDAQGRSWVRPWVDMRAQQEQLP